MLCLKKERIIRVILVLAGLFALGILYGILALKGFALPCVFKYISGYNCPGCGMTRTCVAILTLQFDKLFSYNLLAPLIIAYIIWVAIISIKSYLKNGHASYDSPFLALDISALVVILGWWVVRNILGI